MSRSSSAFRVRARRPSPPIPKRALIGDDEHGWSNDGVFNFEGGCYAKVINLSPEMEPEIYATTRRFGTVLENVAIDPALRRLDLDDAGLTENTRASYALPAIPNIVPESKAGHPRNVIMLTCDAFGVLPPVAKLDSAQAMYHFISGYTAKVAGTEAGVTDPVATFSSCFGAPFMARHPAFYAKMLAARLEEHGASCWLVNTGWSGGPHGVGKRMKISITRTLLNAVLDGSLEEAPMRVDALFGFLVPDEVPEVPSDVLTPAQHLERPQGLRRPGAEAREALQRELHPVPGRRDQGGRRGGPEAGLNPPGARARLVRACGHHHIPWWCPFSFQLWPVLGIMTAPAFRPGRSTQ